MKIVLCYTAVTHGPITPDYCARFVASYLTFPPGVEHSTIVICNGGPLATNIGMMFSSLKAALFPRKNDEGYDLSGYVEAAKGPASDCDAMLCLGESIYFHRQDWLKRLVYAWEKYGPGMYGPFSSHNVRAHLNTSAFMTSPILLQEYPSSGWTRPARYEFEHGTQSFWRKTHYRGMPVRLVTWDGEWAPGMWRMPANILWRGDQSNLLLYCNHSERWFSANAQTRQRWSAKADQPPK